MIIWLASYPRSGNTFLRALLYQTFGVHTYEFYGKDADPGGFRIISSIVGDVPIGRSVPDMQVAAAPYLVKTHDLPRDSGSAVYLVRDGRDALVSHAHFVLDYDWRVAPEQRRARFYDTLRMLIETDVSFGGWRRNVLAWTERSSSTVTVKFEDLIATPVECLRQALAAVGHLPLELETQRVPTFQELHRKMPQFFRKGRVGSWREEMPEDLHELFWQRHGDAMHKMGYR